MCIYFHFPIGVLHLLRVVVSWNLIVPECQIYLVFIAAIPNLDWAFEYLLNLKKKKKKFRFLLLLLLRLLSGFSPVRLCSTPWTAAYQASPSMGFSRQEHWSGLPFPSPMHESGK